MNEGSVKPSAGSRLPTGPSGLYQHDAALLDFAGQVVKKLAYQLHSVTEGEVRAEGVAPDRLCAALLEGDDDTARAMLRAAHNTDTSLRLAYFASLVPAVIRLGEMWDEDLISFVDVSMATGRVFAILRSMRREGFRSVKVETPGRLALVASLPGEEHTLGITLAADLMREAGWSVDLRVGATETAMLADARLNAYPVIALSAARPQVEANVARLIGELRLASPGSMVILCGQMLKLMPGIGPRVGADAAECDFDAAMAIMESYVTV